MKCYFAAGLIPLLAFISCERPETGEREECPMTSHFEVKCAPLEGDGTRSSIAENALTSITNLNVFLYRDGRLEDDLYFRGGEDVCVIFPSAADRYSIYMVANVGNLTAPSSESSVPATVCRFSDYGKFSTDGFPMAASFPDYVPGSSSEFLLDRLVGTYEIRMADTSEKVDYSINGIALRNCARDVYPFGEKAAIQFLSVGDRLSESDLAALREGESVRLYFLENRQGVLLPDNTDPKQKVPDNLPDQYRAARCTYLEVDASASTPTARYDRISYRVYLGSDMTSDFTIERNTIYRMNLDFRSNMVREEGWRIEPDDPEIVGCLKWEIPEIYVAKDCGNFLGDYLIVRRTDPAIDYSVSVNGAEAEDAMMSMQHMGGMTYKVSTTHPVDGFAPGNSVSFADADEPDYKDVHVYLESYDGLLRDTAVVHVCHQAFPIYIKYDSGSHELMAEAYHPCGLKLGFTLLAEVGGEQYYQKNSMAGGSWSHVSESAIWTVPITPVSRVKTSGTRIPLDVDETHSFFGLFSSVEDHRILFDNTWMGTNHSYRPAYPTSFSLSMKVSVSNSAGQSVAVNMADSGITDPLTKGFPMYIYNQPDFYFDGWSFVPFDRALIASGGGRYEVYASGQDMQVSYEHSNGTVYRFMRGNRILWDGESREAYSYHVKIEDSAGVHTVVETGCPRATSLIINTGPAAIGGEFITDWVSSDDFSLR